MILEMIKIDSCRC